MINDQIAEITEEMPSFTTRSGQVALEWMAVIAALGGDYFTKHEDSTWVIFVDPTSFDYFQGQINAYESERGVFEKKLASQRIYHKKANSASYSAFHLSLLLLMIHIIAGPSEMNGPLIKYGAFAITEFFNGEWWRPITALTLHADIAHWGSNCMFLMLFAPALCHRLGSTLTWFFVLAGGICGNITTAFFYEAPHRSLGASTATFAALGLLTGVAVILKLKKDTRLAYTAFMAAIAMVAMTGLNPGSDILAHVFGFCYGLLFALPAYFIHQHLFKLKHKIYLWIIIVLTLGKAWQSAIAKFI